MDKTIDDKSMCNHNYGKQNQPFRRLKNYRWKHLNTDGLPSNQELTTAKKSFKPANERTC